jgi:hypothetical protein
MVSQHLKEMMDRYHVGDKLRSQGLRRSKEGPESAASITMRVWE